MNALIEIIFEQHNAIIRIQAKHYYVSIRFNSYLQTTYISCDKNYNEITD